MRDEEARKGGILRMKKEREKESDRERDRERNGFLGVRKKWVTVKRRRSKKEAEE